MDFGKKFNTNNLPLYVGILGYIIIFILFSIPQGENGQSLYEYFFTFDELALVPFGGCIFFALFIIDFLLYLTLLTLRILKKDTAKFLFLGVIGIIISILVSFALMQYSDSNLLMILFISFDFIGIIFVYLYWIFSCKKFDAYEYDKVKKNNLYFTMFELLCFLFPLALFVGFLILTSGGSSNNNTKRSNVASSQYYSGNVKKTIKKETIKIDDKEYIVKDDILFDIKTKEEVGYLDNDKAVFEIKK